MKNNKKGFTIVELVIVIAVIAILAAVLIPTFSNVIDNAHKSSDLQAAKTKFDQVYADDSADGTVDGKIDGTTDLTGKVASLTKDTAKGSYTYATDGTKVTTFEYMGEHYKVTYTEATGKWEPGALPK